MLFGLVVSFTVVLLLVAVGLRAASQIYNRKYSRPLLEASPEGFAIASDFAETETADEVDNNNPFATPRFFAKSPEIDGHELAGSVPMLPFSTACGVSFFLILLRALEQILVVFLFGSVSTRASGSASTSLQWSILILWLLGSFAIHYLAVSGVIQLFSPTSFRRALAVSGIFHVMFILVGIFSLAIVLPLAWGLL